MQREATRGNARQRDTARGNAIQHEAERCTAMHGMELRRARQIADAVMWELSLERLFRFGVNTDLDGHHWNVHGKWERMRWDEMRWDEMEWD
jgi:hypothetical protein